MAARRWKYFLANSKDLSLIGPLNQARSKTLNLVLNRPGSCSFVLPMDDKFADQINTYSSAILAYRYNWKATRAAKIANAQAPAVWDLVWSGYVLTVQEDVTANRMTVSAVGWLQRLEKRILHRDKVYINQDDGDIILDLLAEMNLTTAPDGITIPVVSGSSPATPTWMTAGSKLPNEGPGGATAYATALRTVKYDRDAIVYQLVDQLSAGIENGCDIWVDPTTRALNIYRKRQSIKSTVIWGYRTQPRNIKQLGRNVDGATQVNYHLTRGDAASTPRYQIGSTMQATIGVLEEVATLNGYKDSSVLQTYASGEVASRQTAREIYTFAPLPFVEAGRVPEPIVDFNIGDQGLFRAKQGKRINVSDMAVRIFGITFTEDDVTGEENISELSIAAP